MALRERLIRETAGLPGNGSGNGSDANGQHSFQEMKSRLHRALINRMDLTKLAAAQSGTGARRSFAPGGERVGPGSHAAFNR
jgi:hypothetical protein